MTPENIERLKEGLGLGLVEAETGMVVPWLPDFMRKAIRAGAHPNETVTVIRPEPIAYPDGMTVERETIEWSTGALHEFTVRHANGRTISQWYQQEAKRSPDTIVDV